MTTKCTLQVHYKNNSNYIKVCGATQPCHVRFAGTRVPAWQLGRAEACGVTLQGVAPRGLARPKGLVLGNLDLDGLLLKY